MGWFAKFKTAYLQREIPLDVVVSTDSYLRVGQMVKLDKDTISAVADATDKAALDSATHIIAQSDTTLEYGHVKVEDRDYRYFPNVEGSISPAAQAANFLGVYAKLSDAPTAAAGNKDKHILVLADGKVYTNTSGSAWAASSTVTAKLKKVALFKIIDKDDLIVRANG